ncbi:hypothetical protein STW0522ENT62_14290 [Enterobacter kobei]|uniref:hypothetical protein n=1 Tax=Enterobacter kobei TaxID=208224 RepID=UPI0018A673FE|nr:hypothetical protein [Enterobacter kobei]BBV85983.1 hypothetical protein STW0522ENT62_14290 [Enterobacter kobei]
MKRKSPNLTFQVVLPDPETGDIVRFALVNFTPSVKMVVHPAYLHAIECDPELQNVHKLLRKYSSQYRDYYPLNAMYEGHTFHINRMGSLNHESKRMYEDYLSTNEDGNLHKFRMLVAIEYSK